MADVNRGNRPLSPHLTIYRWPITMLTSILVRVTGIGIAVAGLLVVWWFVAAATSPGYYGFVNGLITSWLGDLVMTAALWGIWYHAMMGLKHLIWDQVWLLEVEAATKLTWAAVAASVVLTILTLLII